MMKYRIRWALFSVILIVQLTIARTSAYADGSLCPAKPSTSCTLGLSTFQYQLLLGEMAAHPMPDVRPLNVDESELGRSSLYRVVGGSTALYDAPNGSVIDVRNTGFNYIAVRSVQDGWAEILRGRWVRANRLTQANASIYAGVLIEEPLAYPMAWVLQPTQPSSLPGVKPDPTTAMIERYTRVNIFATVKVGDWEWYLVGPKQWLEQRRVARVLPVARPAGVKGRWVAVDLYEQVLVAFEDDRMVFTTLISSGLPRPGFGTNQGLFRMWARRLLPSGRSTLHYVFRWSHQLSWHVL